MLPTGAGKTVTGLSLAKRMGGRCLWLAHREELISQPAQTARVVWPEATHGIVKAEQNQFMRDVVFASIQSAQQPRRLEQLAAQGFGLVVIDEAHRALATGYRALIERLGCYKEGGPQLLGLTATPERSDSGALDEVFQGVVFHLGINTAIEQGYLLAPTVIERSIKLDLDAVTVSRGDYGQKQLDLALMQAGIVGEIVAAYEENCLARKTIVFVVSVAQAHAVADALKARGHAAAAVSGETEPTTRKRILRELASGELRCVVNCMVLTEGFDSPSVDAVILGRPTQSKPMMIQSVGRGLRTHPGKTDCLVIDMVGASKRNTLVQAAVIFGLKAEPVERTARPLDPIADPDEYWRQRYLTQIEGVAGAARTKLRWVSGADGAWLLDSGVYGTVRMLPADGEQWHVDAVGIRIGENRRQQLSDAPVPMDIAQALAEDYVRRANAINRALADAPWRERSASETEIKFLRLAGVDAHEGMSKGTAADLALQVKAKHATEPATPKQIALVRSLYANDPKKVPADMTKKQAQGLIVKAKFRKQAQ